MTKLEMDRSPTHNSEDNSNDSLNSRVSTLVINTPEGIDFSMLLAGPATRALAWSVDLACIVALTSVMGIVVSVISPISRDLSQALYLLFYFILSIGYGVVTEWYWHGQTVGKKILRLRVVDVQGLRLQFSQILIRNLMRIVDSLPAFYLVGGLAALINKRGQRLGDFAANTTVIRNPKVPDPDLTQITSGKFNTLREYPYLGARLRQRVKPREAGIALQALLRRDILEPEDRIQLFEEIAAHFRCMVQFPEKALHGLTDEQYIRNIVDIIYRPKK